MRPQDLQYQRFGATMAYTAHTVQDASAPRTFVLVHGIGMGRIVFSDIAEILAQHGNVLAIDLPGFGDSPESEIAATIEQSAELLAWFVREEARGAVTLIGHSMGTQVVAELANRHPDLLDTLVLIAPTVNRYERTAIQQGARMVQDLTGESPKVLAKGLWEYAKTSPIWFVRKLRFMLHHHLEQICPSIQTPSLVLRGETDRVCPELWVSEVAGLLPHAEMREIPDRGHEALIKTPEPAASLILDFVVSHGT